MKREKTEADFWRRARAQLGRGRTGMELWRGPSEIDQKPIVFVGTAMVPKHGEPNAKTGDVIQGWILRADVNPLRALELGEDRSICGDCCHRPKGGTRTCYPNMRLVHAVWRTWLRGGYTARDELSARQLNAILRRRGLRFGAYGDPAALPTAVVRGLARTASMWLGYTHQWRTCDPKLRAFLMASVDTEAERAEARAAGWRTFRIRPPYGRLLKREIVCPADPAVQVRTQCVRCKLCDGTRGKQDRRSDIVVVGHGPAARTLNERLKVLNDQGAFSFGAEE